MKTSEQGIALLREREGERLRAYLDVAGVATIGVGHTGPGITLGLVWSPQQSADALKKDVEKCEKTIALYCVHKLKQCQFDALVSFIFNIGVNAFVKSTLLRKLNQGDFEGAAAQFDRWNIPAAIISRRMGEKQQFLGKQFKARIL